MSSMILTTAECLTLCREAALGAGAHDGAATALARATVAAEAAGNSAIGLGHFEFYLDALRAGRIDGRAEPAIERPLPSIFHVDARRGTAHYGYALVRDRLIAAVRTAGLGIFAQKNAFTCGALGYFAQQLAEAGLVALAATNGPALITAAGGRRPVYCTNPLAFAAPLGEDDTLLIDQSSSQTAYVKLRQAAERGESIPEGWAIDGRGRPTTDARAAIEGALLAFGGARGANIALMVEVLAAGLTGANWSLDAPSITQGPDSPQTGLFVLAVDPAAFGQGFAARLSDHAARLEAEGIHIPGRARRERVAAAGRDGMRVPRALVQRIAAFADPAP